MLQRVTFLQDHNKVFDKGFSLEFKDGVNILVGEQGCGKSTLLRAILKSSQKSVSKEKIIKCDIKGSGEVKYFDFEKDNLRTKGYFGNNMLLQVSSMFMSHGQSNLNMLHHLIQCKNTLFLMDEPDMALSIRSCYKLVDMFKKSVEKENQIIVSVHNPIIISGFDEVYSLEHRGWMASKEFIEDHSK